VEGFEAKYNFPLLFQIPSFSLKENIGGTETNRNKPNLPASTMNVKRTNQKQCRKIMNDSILDSEFQLIQSYTESEESQKYI